MRYKVVAWKDGLVRATYKTDNPALVNYFVRCFKIDEAYKIEVFEISTLTRKVFEWKK